MWSIVEAIISNERSLLPAAAVFKRGDILAFFELFDEISGILDPTFISDFIDGFSGESQQPFGVGDPLIGDVVGDPDPEFVFELAAKIIFGNIESAGQFLERDLLAEILVDILADLIEFVIQG